MHPKSEILIHQKSFSLYLRSTRINMGQFESSDGRNMSLYLIYFKASSVKNKN